MPDFQDPFEAYRAKKAADKKKPEVAQPKAPPREDGRPQGFATHRMDFDKSEDAAPAPAPPPKGFDSGKLGKLKPIDPGQKPKGFGKDRLGPGPKKPIDPDEEPPPRRKGE